MSETKRSNENRKENASDMVCQDNCSPRLLSDGQSVHNQRYPIVIGSLKREKGIEGVRSLFILCWPRLIQFFLSPFHPPTA